VDGRSVDTTTGFTPLEGLVMATRSGSVDPGLVLWLQEHGGIPAAELADTLEHRSGPRGLAGTADMKTVLAATEAGDPDARLAADVYVHHLRAGVTAMAAAMGGLDDVVFTGGVGENAPAIRDRRRGPDIPRDRARRHTQPGTGRGSRHRRGPVARQDAGRGGTRGQAASRSVSGSLAVEEGMRNDDRRGRIAAVAARSG
jgi:acetate kinase